MESHRSRAKPLFLAALERPAGERRAFLEEACRDDRALLAEVLDLLSHGEEGKTDDWGESPVVRVETAGDSAWPAGRRVGSYTLLERLGHGGMGDVYLAKDDDTFERRVAVKVVRRGMDTDHLLARFDLEREALSRLDHTHIATVLGAGATADGRPFFAMEYVPGESITDYSDHLRLGLEKRLELFLQVCEEVQHAHERSIVHRDIKPSNVLIKLENERPVAKVIDFGIAKVLGNDAAGRITLTRDGQAPGTPEYMSPEQASRNLDIDARTDVYSLGVLLYDLLTGILPFASRDGESPDRDEVLRRTREEDPPRPSTRFGEPGGQVIAAAASRASVPVALARALRGDLDVIVLKALARDRNHRYPSVAAFAADVRRYIESEPIDARPPSSVYRLRRFAKRHRQRIALAAVALVLVLLAGAIFAAFHIARLAAHQKTARQALADGDLAPLLASVNALDGMFLSQPFLRAPLSEVAKALREPDAVLSRIAGHLSRREDEAALTVAAATVGRSLQSTPREATESDRLLARFLLRHTEGAEVSSALRSHAFMLIARLFLENPVDTPLEIEASGPFRDRLLMVLERALQDRDSPDHLYVVAALGCCGTRQTAEPLLRAVQDAPCAEGRRVLLCALERLSRRLYLCKELDDLGRGWKSMLEPLGEHYRRSLEECGEDVIGLNVGHWLEYAAGLGNSAEVQAAKVKARFKDTDEFDEATHLASYVGPGGQVVEETTSTEVLTEPDPNPDRAAADVLATWDFSHDRFWHDGIAGPAEGILTKKVSHENRNLGHLRLNRFGQSRVVLPFEIEQVSGKGIRLELRHLVAARNSFPYRGFLELRVLLNGNAISPGRVVTMHGVANWDPFPVSREMLRPGPHEFTIALGARSTTTYWVYEAKIVRVED